jgi:hypothetical protein
MLFINYEVTDLISKRKQRMISGKIKLRLFVIEQASEKHHHALDVIYMTQVADLEYKS